jgi:hypothetical protein
VIRAGFPCSQLKKRSIPVTCNHETHRVYLLKHRQPLYLTLNSAMKSRRHLSWPMMLNTPPSLRGGVRVDMHCQGRLRLIIPPA